MKFSKLSQLFLVSSIGLLVATLLTACQLVTIDYVFVAASAGSGSSRADQTFAVDSESGASAHRAADRLLRRRWPVAMAVTNYYRISTSPTGKHERGPFHHRRQRRADPRRTRSPWPQRRSPWPSTPPAPTSMWSPEPPPPRSPSIPSLRAPSALRHRQQVPLSVPGYAGDTIVPTGVDVLANNNASTSRPMTSPPTTPAERPPAPPTRLGLWLRRRLRRRLTASPAAPTRRASSPAASPPTHNRFVYVTDFASNELIGYTIQSGSILNFLVNGPFKTGNEPSAVVIDPRGKSTST
jgi:6-phosphogluconolactonase